MKYPTANLLRQDVQFVPQITAMAGVSYITHKPFNLDILSSEIFIFTQLFMALTISMCPSLQLQKLVSHVIPVLMPIVQQSLILLLSFSTAKSAHPHQLFVSQEFVSLFATSEGFLLIFM